jgi:hypothetical protein
VASTRDGAAITRMIAVEERGRKRFHTTFEKNFPVKNRNKRTAATGKTSATRLFSGRPR